MIIRPLMRILSPAGDSARLSTLIFHRVLPEVDPLFPDEVDRSRFERITNWIADWFNVLPLEEAIARLALGELPERAAAITFDDGYADNFTQAAPVLKRKGLHATFFIASGFLNGGRMWNDTLIESVRSARVETLDAKWLDLGLLPIADVTQKRETLQRLIPAIKHLAPAARAKAVERVSNACDADLPHDLMLTTEQLRGLRNLGMGIGAHTVNHPILAKLDSAVALREISQGRDDLQSIIGERVGLFAYPNGKPGTDYLPEHVEMVRSLGFEGAVSTAWGASRHDTDPFQLRRFTPWDRSRLTYGLRLARNMAVSVS